MRTLGAIGLNMRGRQRKRNWWKSRNFTAWWEVARGEASSLLGSKVVRWQLKLPSFRERVIILKLKKVTPNGCLQIRKKINFNPGCETKKKGEGSEIKWGGEMDH